MNSVATLSATTASDKAKASAAGQAQQADASSSGFLAMLDGMLQSSATGKAVAAGSSNLPVVPDTTKEVDEQQNGASSGESTAEEKAIVNAASGATISADALLVAGKGQVLSGSSSDKNITDKNSEDKTAEIVPPVLQGAPIIPSATPLANSLAASLPAAKPTTLELNGGSQIKAPQTSTSVLAVNQSASDATADATTGANQALPLAPAVSGGQSSSQPGVKNTQKATTDSDNNPSATIATVQQSDIALALMVSGQNHIDQVSSQSAANQVSGIGAASSQPNTNSLSSQASKNLSVATDDEESADATGTEKLPAGEKGQSFGIGNSAVSETPDQSQSQSDTAGGSQDNSPQTQGSAPLAAQQARPELQGAPFFSAPVLSESKVVKSDAVEKNGDNTIGAANSTSSIDNTANTGITFLHQNQITAGGPMGQTNAANAAYVAAPLPATEQVSIQMQRAIADGSQSMTIALDPANLGKVQVKLDFGKDGAVQASVTADRPETLAMLKNDHSTLHQALQNAGLSPDTNSLSFNLRGDDRSQGQASNNNSASRAQVGTIDATPDVALAAQYTVHVADGRVDVLV